MCPEMKGNIFFSAFLVFDILPTYKIICYTYIVVIYCIFIYWDMLKKNVTVAKMIHTKEASEEVPSDGTCPVFKC